MHSVYFSIHQKESVLLVIKHWWFRHRRRWWMRKQQKNKKIEQNGWSKWIKPHWFIFIQKAVISTASTWQGLGRKLLEFCTVTDTICIDWSSMQAYKTKVMYFRWMNADEKSLATLAVWGSWCQGTISSKICFSETNNKWGGACKAYNVYNVHNQSQ